MSSFKNGDLSPKKNEETLPADFQTMGGEGEATQIGQNYYRGARIKYPARDGQGNQDGQAEAKKG